MKEYLLKPFTVLNKKNIKVSFILWLVFVIGIGNSSILGTIIANWDNFRWGTVVLNFKLGNFYMFALACLAFGIYEYANEYYYMKKDIRFRGIKLVSGAISLLLMFLILMFFSSNCLSTDLTLKQIIDENAQAGITFQVFMYISSILISIYMFCVNKLDQFETDFDSIDDYIQREKDDINSLNNKIINKPIDDGGIEL